MDAFSIVLVVCGAIAAVGCLSFGLYDLAHDRQGRGIALIVASPVAFFLGAILVGVAVVAAVAWLAIWALSQ